MKLLIFAASNKRLSINKIFVQYAAQLVEGASIELLDLNDYEMPLFSEDIEKEAGHPPKAHQFLSKIAECDALMISFAEHNGSYSVAYKNIFDWCSRINNKVYQNKPIVLLATSPGEGGGGNVLAAAKNSLPYFNGIVKESFSLPAFYDNFDVENNTLREPALIEKLRTVVNTLNNED